MLIKKIDKFFFILFIILFTIGIVWINSKSEVSKTVNSKIISFSNSGEIKVIDAEHLNKDKSFISNIFTEINSLDGNWSEKISDGDYIRIIFERNLTSENDIKIYPKIISGNPKIEVYEKNKNELIAEFNPLTSDEFNRILLTNLKESQNTFDLKIVGGEIKVDYIVDPQTYLVPTQDGFQNLSQGAFTEGTNTFSTNSPSNQSCYIGINVSGGQYCANFEGTTALDAYVLWNVTLPNYTAISNIYVTSTIAQATANGTDTLAIMLYNYSSSAWKTVNWTSNPGNINRNVTLLYNLTSASTIANFVNGKYMKFIARSNGTANTATDIFVDFMQVRVYYTETTPPFLNITYPTVNNSNFSVNTVNINYTASDGAGIDSCWYTNDTKLVNISLGTHGVCNNITNVLWSDGNHNVTIYVNDTNNNVANSGISFNISSAPANSCTYSGTGNWDINCADACIISSNVIGSDATKYNVTFSGLGNVILNANVSNFLNYFIYGNSGCNITCNNGNCIQN